ncbi:hypothetical protein [Bacteroides graminisolvens]|uniref:hypothetical protein n=1 Tax=Bacteroides graminisolvens TaxID=477666 RepID=UPI0029C6EB24|nr:hypothetical protein [Bacteroides graminisolvens]
MEKKPIDYKAILSMFLPKGMLDYFDFIDYSDMGEYYIFSSSTSFKRFLSRDNCYRFPCS